MSDHPIDFAELMWLVGRYRHADEDAIRRHGRKWWLEEIREDYGDDVADTVMRCIEAEDPSHRAIEEARQTWHAKLAETYLFVLDAFQKRGTDVRG